MHDLDMTQFEERLESRLRLYAGIEVRPGSPRLIAREAMASRRRSGLAMAWVSLRPPVRLALVFALLGSLLVGGLLIGSRLLRPILTVTQPSPSFDVPSNAPLGGPAGEDIRSRWLANVGTIPGLGNGSGPVTLTIDPTGSVLALANLDPGASFTSRTSSVAGDELRIELVSDSGGCRAGAEGVYGLVQSTDGSRLTITAVSDACPTRSVALSRTWDRTLVGPTTVGAGIVDTFDPPFAIRLPDARYEARTLDDFIEIADPGSGFSLIVFKNPQGFADSCSTDEVRYPYTPGAGAFVDYYRQNDAFTVIEATPLQIDRHDAIHLVTKIRVEGARCPGADLYAVTPRNCNCHFYGGDDSIYLIDIGADTFFFQLSPTTDSAAEMPIINTIRIPYVPGEPSP